MEIKIHSVRFDAREPLQKFVNAKVGKLSQYFDEIVSAEVFLKVDKPQNVDNKIAEVRLHIPGNELFAKKQADSFEEAVDLAVEAVRRQVKKHKEKIKG